MTRNNLVLTSDQLLAILSHSKTATAIYTGNDFTIQFASEAMLRFWNKDKSVIGMPLKEVVPDEAAKVLTGHLQSVAVPERQNYTIEMQANFYLDGKLQKLLCINEYQLINNEQGNAILHTIKPEDKKDAKEIILPTGSREQELYEEVAATNEELTATNEELAAINEELLESRLRLENLNKQLDERVKARTAELLEAKAEAEAQRDRMKRFIMQAPAGICILDGPDLVFELVNPFYQQLFPGRQLLGQPLAKAVPEIKDGSLLDTLQNVYTTGKTFEGKEILFPLPAADGKLEDRYFTFIYQARLDAHHQIDGILVFVIEVTDAVLNRKRIQENEARLRNLVMTSHYGLMILKGKDLVIDIVNQQIANLWQKPLAEITGKKLLDVLPELEGQPFPALLNKVYQSGVGYGQEEEVFYLESPEGKVQKHVSFYYDPLFNHNGEVNGIIVACEDISEKIKSKLLLEESYGQQQSLNEELSATNEELAAVNEELSATNEELLQTQSSLQKTISDLEESENRIKNIVANAPFPIGVYQGREMRIVMANKSIMEVWGKGDDVTGKLYSEVLPELENQEIFEQLDSVYTSGVPFHARNQQVDLMVDGKMKTFYFNYSFTPLYDTKEHIYGVMNTAADVTDLYLAKQKIERNEQNLHNMILQAPVAMCILSGPEHVITVANKKNIELWGKPAEAVMNKPVFEALPDARNQGLEQYMANVYLKGETFQASEMPVSLIRNGLQEVVYQNFVYQPYKDPDGTIMGIIAITIDITEQVLARKKIEQSEAELLETKKQLEAELEAGKEVQRQKDSFIGIASHELKTPLTSLTAIIQVAQNKLKNSNDSFLTGAMDNANLQVKRMISMINSFLNISRLESGKIRIEKVFFDLDDLICQTIDEFKFTTLTHKINYTGCGEVFVCADKDKISSVITNLINNAIKYSPKADSVEVKCEVNGQAAIVSVEDKGIGISPQDRERIFDRYYRVKTDHTQHISGFGIGLYLSAEIVKRHKGKIWVESKAGQGSVFYFTLPLPREN